MDYDIKEAIAPLVNKTLLGQPPKQLEKLKKWWADFEEAYYHSQVYGVWKIESSSNWLGSTRDKHKIGSLSLEQREALKKYGFPFNPHEGNDKGLVPQAEKIRVKIVFNEAGKNDLDAYEIIKQHLREIHKRRPLPAEYIKKYGV
jgi:hypothetical protein